MIRENRLEEKEKVFRKVLSWLSDTLTYYFENPDKLDEEFLEQLRDALIKRFEYSIDVFVKYLRLYLIQHHGEEPTSPKSTIRKAFETGLLSDEETTTILDMIDSRNLTSHAYNKDLAEQISEEIPGYYEVMKMVVGRIEI
jgi:nucleotidyltransferase substrate binding protein (TIGR01987 family)